MRSPRVGAVVLVIVASAIAPAPASGRVAAINGTHGRVISVEQLLKESQVSTHRLG